MLIAAFGGNNTAGDIDVATAVNAHGGPHGRLDFESETFIAHTLRADGFDAGEDGTGRGTPLTLAIRGRGDSHDLEYRDDDTANAILTPNGGRAGIGVGAIALPMTVRRLTPRECERLQGFPDDYTAITYRGKPAADGPRYRALGNSMAVPVVRWIGERISAQAKDASAIGLER
jgi:DNA (cytosine-5)-methyltransferase 1